MQVGDVLDLMRDPLIIRTLVGMPPNARSRAGAVLSRASHFSRGLSISLAFFVVFLAPTKGTTYDIRHAFCLDQLRNYNSNYENAKIYNYCIQNADRLIREMENRRRRQQDERRRNEPARRKQAEQAERARRQEEMQKLQDRQAAELERIRRERQLDLRYEKLFGNF